MKGRTSDFSTVVMKGDEQKGKICKLVALPPACGQKLSHEHETLAQYLPTFQGVVRTDSIKETATYVIPIIMLLMTPLNP